MRHHILVKWKDSAEKPALAPVRALFEEVLRLPGVYSVSLHPNVVNRENRYDLLILICMDRDALDAYDASAAHKRWKEEYGDKIQAKAIFDCE